jgi:hypothetical protein
MLCIILLLFYIIPVSTLENEEGSFTDVCDIVELELEKENVQYTLQANSLGLTKQPQKSEERIDETGVYINIR